MEDSYLTQWAHRILTETGVKPETAHLLDQFVILALILLTAWVADTLCRLIIVGGGKRLAQRTDRMWQELLLNPQVLRKFSDLIPVILIYMLLPLAFPEKSHTPDILQKICLVYIVFIALMFVNIVLKVTFTLLSRRSDMHDRPLKGVLQIMQVGLFFLGTILVVSLIVNRSPAKMLTGLGASAAILMLIFKDSILGLVSGIMLSANKMLKPGDWISMPKYDVDGTVIEVTLNTVKIENFDNTVTTIPPFVLTGDSFRNWQRMVESGGRRIMRSVNIDMDSVRFCTPDMLERYAQNALVRDFIARHDERFAPAGTMTGTNGPAEKPDGKASAPDGHDATTPEEGRTAPDDASLHRLTNLTVFRAYLNAYLQRLSVVNHEQTCMVRHLQPTTEGIPVEIYCFSAIKVWTAYEQIQADLFDHVIAVVREFDLEVFQRPTGSDLRKWLEAERGSSAAER